jgi:hypothetical protein
MRGPGTKARSCLMALCMQCMRKMCWICAWLAALLTQFDALGKVLLIACRQIHHRQYGDGGEEEGDVGGSQHAGELHERAGQGGREASSSGFSQLTPKYIFWRATENWDLWAHRVSVAATVTAIRKERPARDNERDNSGFFLESEALHTVVLLA